MSTLRVPIGSFQLFEGNNKFTDTAGHSWKQVTVQGWIREEDGFFWPVHPTASLNEIKAPTVAEVSARRIKNHYR